MSYILISFVYNKTIRNCIPNHIRHLFINSAFLSRIDHYPHRNALYHDT